jgi:hypothetical protein
MSQPQPEGTSGALCFVLLRTEGGATAIVDRRAAKPVTVDLASESTFSQLFPLETGALRLLDETMQAASLEGQYGIRGWKVRQRQPSDALTLIELGARENARLPLVLRQEEAIFSCQLDCLMPARAVEVENVLAQVISRRSKSA